MKSASIVLEVKNSRNGYFNYPKEKFAIENLSYFLHKNEIKLRFANKDSSKLRSFLGNAGDALMSIFIECADDVTEEQFKASSYSIDLFSTNTFSFALASKNDPQEDDNKVILLDKEYYKEILVSKVASV
jgi:hypothetical protein